MATLYITEQGTTLRKEQNRLVVERDEVISEIHEFKLERVVIFGNVQLTTQVISFLLERGIDTTFLSFKGRLKGRLAPLASKNVLLRISQYERAGDPRFALDIAIAVVSAKIANCAEILRRHQRNHPECDLSSEVSQLAALNQRASHRQTLDSLRGIEGQAAAIYFQGFARLLRRNLTSRSALAVLPLTRSTLCSASAIRCFTMKPSALWSLSGLILIWAFITKSIMDAARWRSI